MKKNKQNLKTVLAICLVFTLMSAPCMAQKFEGLADRPQMGWSTWNKFQGNISEEIIKGIADVVTYLVYAERCRRISDSGLGNSNRGFLCKNRGHQGANK